VLLLKHFVAQLPTATMQLQMQQKVEILGEVRPVTKVTLAPLRRTLWIGVDPPETWLSCFQVFLFGLDCGVLKTVLWYFIRN